MHDSQQQCTVDGSTVRGTTVQCRRDNSNTTETAQATELYNTRRHRLDGAGGDTYLYRMLVQGRAASAVVDMNSCLMFNMCLPASSGRRNYSKSASI